MSSDFEQEVQARVDANARNESLKDAAENFMRASMWARYSYNFSWLGRPIIQYPQDMVALQQLVWKVRPDLIIETGIAHGGSLVLSASLLAMLDYCDAAAQGKLLDPKEAQRKVIGVDIEIRPHNRAALEAHPLYHKMELIEGSSIAPDVIEQVHAAASQHERIMVLLDSNHTHEHVLAELHAYAPLVSPGSYCIVYDTVVKHMPDEMFPDRPWDSRNNPATAVSTFLSENDEFEVDMAMDHALMISVAPGGFLKRIAGD